jgi:LytS/YehU family sensor histidine kinase
MASGEQSASLAGAPLIPRRARRWARRTGKTVAVAVVIALGLSLQFLAQPYIWRDWPLHDIAVGWLCVCRDRVIVATFIAAAISLVRRTQVLRIRSGLLALGVAAGAVVGEICVVALYDQEETIGSVLMHALRWSAIALAAAAIYYLWRNASDTRDQLRRGALRRQRAEQLMTTTRLAALRQQIEPHFLFNTLATVRRLHQTEPAAGAVMLANFIDYLRRLLPMLDRALVTLGDEVTLIDTYLAVVSVRMAGRLQIRIELPEKLRGVNIPTLALATLVENAVKHGIAPLPDGGEIHVSATAEHGFVSVCVADNGVGLKADGAGGSGIGLYNIRTRLAALHGSRGTLRVEGNGPRGVRATMRFPLYQAAA